MISHVIGVIVMGFLLVFWGFLIYAAFEWERETRESEIDRRVEQRYGRFDV